MIPKKKKKKKSPCSGFCKNIRHVTSAASHSDVQYIEKSMDYASLCDEADGM